MKAMNAPRLPRTICRARKQISLDNKQVYFSTICSMLKCILHFSTFKLERKVKKIQNSVFINYSRCIWGQCSVAIVRTSQL